MVRWTSPTILYALYKDFRGSSASLTIGYSDDQYRTTPDHLTVQTLPSGKYVSINVHGNEISSLTRAWNSVSFSTMPLAILEKYQLDEHGKIANIQLEVKY